MTANTLGKESKEQSVGRGGDHEQLVWPPQEGGSVPEALEHQARGPVLGFLAFLFILNR